MKYFIIALAIIIYLGISLSSFTVSTYNTLVGEQNDALTQRANLQAQYQRRFDLVPNIVATTKGAMTQEQAVFGEISKAYGAFQTAAPGTPQQMAAGDQLGLALRGWMMVVLQYPNLRSLDQIKQLTDTITATEDNISAYREKYNSDVQTYDQTLQTFPKNVVGSWFGFQSLPRYSADEPAQHAPQVNLK